MNTSRWRYNLPAVKVVGVNESDTIEMPVLILNSMGADFDGDCVAVYRVHSQAGKKEMLKNAYTKNNVIYDHNQNLTQTLNLDTLYAASVLLNAKPTSEESISIASLSDLGSFYEINLNQTIQFQDKVFSFAVCLFNKFCNFDEIKITKFTNTNDISKVLYENSETNNEYQLRINELCKNLFWFISTHQTEVLTISPDELNKLTDLVPKRINHLLQNLPKNPFIGQCIWQYAVEAVYKLMPEEFQLKKLTYTKLNKTQFARILVSIGYIADASNLVSFDAVKTPLINGLSSEDFFNTALGTRKGLVDKDKLVPESGSLERSMVMNLSAIELISKDCQTNNGLLIRIQDKKHAISLIGRWFQNSKKSWTLSNESNMTKRIGKEIIFRSPVTCGIDEMGICRKCFGNYKLPTPYVGILAGQYITERLTQLSLSSFHTSGSCTISTDKTIINFIDQHLLKIDGNALIFDCPILPAFSNIPGFIKSSNQNIAVFQELNNIPNEDVTKKIKEIKILLKNSNVDSIQDIIQFYDTFCSTILLVGPIYSTYIEIVMSNMFITDDDKIYRHQLTKTPNTTIKLKKKLGIKRLHTRVSKLLSLLHEPNEKTIHELKNKSKLSSNTIFENIWKLF